MFKTIKDILIAIIKLATLFGIVGFMLYEWFCPENIKDTLISIGIIGGMWLFSKIYSFYKKCRAYGVISDKTAEKIVDGIDITFTIITIVIPIVMGIIYAILWIIGII